MQLPILTVGILLILTIFVGGLVWRARRQRRAAEPPRTAAIPTVPFELLCIDGPLKGKVYPFTTHRLTLGRGSDNDIMLPGVLVSRFHADVSLEGERLMLRDLDSTNGTWVNGFQISRQHLQAGQQFQVGGCIFAVHATQQATVQVQTQPPPAPAPTAAFPAQTLPQPEQLELDQYQISSRTLGEGGTAAVYLAHDVQTGDPVAIKFLNAQVDDYFRQKFRAEGEVGKQLVHPHIVRTLGWGETVSNKRPLSYIVMEYVGGGSLRTLLNQQQLTLQQAIQIIGQICSALEFAHGKQIYHRDIKPENLLFTRDGAAKLADFGIARWFTRHRTVTQDGIIVGTPEYMSYEQAKGTPVDGRSDQYSLAIVLYEMLAGRPPFEGSPLTIVGKHLTEKPTSPRMFNKNIPKPIEKVIMTALEKEANSRFPSMTAMAKALGYDPAAPPIAVMPKKKTAEPYGYLINLATSNVLPIINSPTVLGRDNLQTPTLPEEQARLWVDTKGFIIEHLGTSGTTVVNNVPIQVPTRILPDSQIHFGPAFFQLKLDQNHVVMRK